MHQAGAVEGAIRKVIRDCAFCGDRVVHATPAHPQCDHCAAPLPQVPGPAVVCREVAPCA